MTGMEIFLLVCAVLGGLALFIFGMSIMTDGLRLAAGPGLRSILSRTGRNRPFGLMLGTAMGALVHSSATTVMLVGFVNAGLMTLAESIPPMLGANIGTTVSMQAISLKLGSYCYFAVALGLFLKLIGRTSRTRNLGGGILGFGLLFLGMNTMSEAIGPHKDALAPLLAGIEADSTRGLLLGLGIATALTAIWQSSGATIGICFALASAGVFTNLNQVFPIVLGAHIGTCATALLGSIGTNVEARRTAVAHVLFNVFNVAVAIAARPLLLRYVPVTSSDLVRQVANLHTAVMLLSALPLLPLSRPYSKLVRLIVHSRRPLPETTFLDPTLLKTPEQAIRASIRELHRVAEICGRSFRLVADVMILKYKPRTVPRIRRNEIVINEIKTALGNYLAAMTARRLSRRQAILIQHVDRCMVEIERIGDHISAVCNFSLRRETEQLAIVSRDVLERLFQLYKAANHVLRLVIDSLDTERKDFQETAETILAARDAYVEQSLDAKAFFADKVTGLGITPIAGIYLAEYVAAFDRLVRHAKTIALAEKHQDFWIKRKKLERVAEEVVDVDIPERVDARDFLDKLQLEDYL